MDPSIIDRELPAFDVVIVESIVVNADGATTYQAARSLDFMRVRTPLLAFAFWVRRAARALRSQAGDTAAAPRAHEGRPAPGLARPR